MASRLGAQQRRAAEWKSVKCDCGVLEEAGMCFWEFLIHLLCVPLRTSLRSDVQVKFIALTSFGVTFFLLSEQCHSLRPKQVCVCEKQSMLGFEVEVISLIGTLPCFLLLSLCHLFPLMMLFSALSSLSLSPPLLLSNLIFLLFTISPPTSSSLSLSVPFHFTLVFCSLLSVFSSKLVGNRDIDCRERSRPWRQDKRGRDRGDEKNCHSDWESRWSRSPDSTHTHAHFLIADRANSVYTYRVISWQANHCYWVKMPDTEVFAVTFRTALRLAFHFILLSLSHPSLPRSTSASLLGVWVSFLRCPAFLFGRWWLTAAVEHLHSAERWCHCRQLVWHDFGSSHVWVHRSRRQFCFSTDAALSENTWDWSEER